MLNSLSYLSLALLTLVGTAHAETSGATNVWVRNASDQISAWNSIQQQAVSYCAGWNHYNFSNRYWQYDRSQGGDCWWTASQSQDYGVNLGNFFNPDRQYSNPGTWIVPENKTTYQMSCYTAVYCSQ